MTELEIKKLMLVADLLHTADVMLQEVVGDSDLCYDLHNRIEDIADEVLEIVQTNVTEDA